MSRTTTIEHSQGNRPAAGSRSRFTRAGMAVVAVLVLGVLSVWQAGRGETIVPNLAGAGLGTEPQRENDPAPAFRLPVLSGDGSIALGDYRGEVVVLNFWASWCGPCRQEAPDLEGVWEQYRERRVQFLGVDHADARGDAIAFRRAFGVTYPSVFDPAGQVAIRYHLLGLPTTLIISPAGRIAYRIVGKTDASTLRTVVSQVLGG